MDGETQSVRVQPSMLPHKSTFDVNDSSFFCKWDKLPSPLLVQAQAKAHHLAGFTIDPRRLHTLTGPYVRPPPVVFEDMGLLVKWGTSVSITEAVVLYAIRRFLKGRVPVPEVYGWCNDGDIKYIYMEHVRGSTLEDTWDTMSTEDRVAICSKLRTTCDSLRQLEQEPANPFVGSILKGPLYDRSINLDYMSEAGPFPSVRDFNNWFTFLYRRKIPDPHSIPIEPFRTEIPDDCAIKFTHGDLHPTNIIVSSQKPYLVLALVDWEQSGWLPEYWEARKAQYTADRSNKWSIRYLPMILEQYASTWDPWDYYTTSMGC
ncbi:hypothetical protein BDV06DRAFT_204035 [Aspergillus oleicola]